MYFRFVTCIISSFSAAADLDVVDVVVVDGTTGFTATTGGEDRSKTLSSPVVPVTVGTEAMMLLSSPPPTITVGTEAGDGINGDGLTKVPSGRVIGGSVGTGTGAGV